jgi:lipoprotein-anchoring transpeptidase ErfK/SrfK
MVQRRTVILTALGAAAGLVSAGCSTPSHAGSDGHAAPGSGAGGSASPSSAPIRLTVIPAAGATDVSPGEPVVVTVEGGTLRSVTVSAGGQPLVGAVDAGGATWRSTGPLAYGQAYTVTASVLDGAGAAVDKTSTFTTLKPSAVTAVTFQANGLLALKTGGTYGVGQPVILAFGKAVTDKAAVEKAIVIKTTPAVEGKFNWLDGKTVHWRPAQYWAKGTTVEVSANLLGVKLGNGLYGAGNASTHFTVGRSLVAICDTSTHRTQVFIDGQLARDMACSTGKGGYTTLPNGSRIHFWTQNGPHVVLSKQQTVSMSSASYGLTDKNNPNYYAPEDVHLCTRISYSGEFLHAAPWNHVLGKANISHGCVNLSQTDAQWVYDTFMVGDIVDVRNSPKPLPIWDGCGDWNVPYDKY